MEITKAKDLLSDEEVAVVVFTHGGHFHYNSNGDGETGNWVIDPEMVDEVDKVIIYLRKDRQGSNQVFIGNYSGVKPSPERGRNIISFSKLKEAGTTNSNWNEFAGGSQNPISYVGV